MTLAEYQEFKRLLLMKARVEEDFGQGECVMRLESDVYVGTGWWEFVLPTERQQVLFVLIDYYSYEELGLELNDAPTEELLEKWNNLLAEDKDCIYFTTAESSLRVDNDRLSARFENEGANPDQDELCMMIMEGK